MPPTSPSLPCMAWIFFSLGTARILPTRNLFPRSGRRAKQRAMTARRFALRKNSWEPEPMKDPIVEEVRRAREQHAAKFQFDLKKIIAGARRRERASGRKVVSFVPRSTALAAKD